jgi:hypothetical protein
VSMAKKRTKTDKLQRNVERLATRDTAVREKSEISDKRPEPASKIPDPELKQQIRLRAYEFYEARGREDNHDLDDWLKAEAEFLGRAKKAAAA